MNEWWFRKRKWGWGWTPISIEGWILTGLLIYGIYGYAIMDWKLKWFPFIFLLICFAYLADYKTKKKVLFK